ncbi:F-box protein At2g41170 isoform X2 [Raphanus sativus]|uniref:F-box protein At2g41170 isoform X2 n=1 Tax=Raphanus sativus TaxID=3726 RepID=A0A9W3DN45_RAPSA|nr:F-box protein At2g41170 isoform X2 [Raphanus sativus]
MFFMQFSRFLFNTICGLLGYCLARHVILCPDGTIRTFAWRRETKRRKKDDLFLDDGNKMSLLDLPNLTLGCILEKLSASELCGMACVCSELRDICVSDHFWKKLMEKKWGRLMGAAATQEWKSHVDAMLMGRPSCGSKRRRSSSSRVAIDSVMYWYSNLESGKFWFSAQVKKNNIVSIRLGKSYYDAKVRYDSKTDTFEARTSAGLGRPAAEVNVTWQMLSPPLTDKESRVLHLSDSLQGLGPDYCFEIQWRKTEELPYEDIFSRVGWWLGFVGHLQNCHRTGNCCCLSHENVVLTFNRLLSESPPPAYMVVNRKNYRECGNEAKGFYGGLRNLDFALRLQRSLGTTNEEGHHRV